MCCRLKRNTLKTLHVCENLASSRIVTKDLRSPIQQTDIHAEFVGSILFSKRRSKSVIQIVSVHFLSPTFHLNSLPLRLINPVLVSQTSPISCQTFSKKNNASKLQNLKYISFAQSKKIIQMTNLKPHK